MIIIRQADKNDIDKIMDFIGKHWNSNHILSKNKAFFEWMYVEEKDCNFIVAYDDKTEQLIGIEGFIKYNSSDTPDIAGNMWKVLKSDNPLLGMDVGKKLYEILTPRCDVAPGVNKKAMKINEILGYKVGKLEHWYIPGICKEYKIASINTPIQRKENIGNIFLDRVTDKETLWKVLDDTILRENTPYKDLKYIQHRYMDHPIYQYDLWYEKNIRNLIIVGREINYNNAKAYKIVDIIGDFTRLESLLEGLYTILYDNSYEFIDLYEFGIEDSILRNAGFYNIEDGKDIIPNYFAPFVKENIDIYFASSKSENLYIFIGDGDQDRPN